MIDQVRAWGFPNRIVVADAGYGDTTEFREELEARQLPYVVGISSTTGVWSKPPQTEVPRYQGRRGPPERLPYWEQPPACPPGAGGARHKLKRVCWRGV